MSGLTKEEQKVLSCIPTGHENAITAKDISRLTGMSDRDVRSVIQGLIFDGYAIGSSVSGNRGYFKIESKEDFNVAIKHLKPRAINIFRRIKALEKVAAEKYDMQMSINELLA